MTNDLDVNAVGAMDVSWSEAQRAETNVIARGGDRATTMESDDRAMTMGIRRRRHCAMSTISGRRRSVVAAGDYVRAKTPLRSVFPLTSIAPTALTSTFMLSRRCRVGCNVVAARSSLRAITFAPKLRCAPFCHSHPSPHCADVAIQALTPLSRRLRSSSRMPTTAKPSLLGEGWEGQPFCVGCRRYETKKRLRHS
jgi:hypothetical protein